MLVNTPDGAKLSVDVSGSGAPLLVISGAAQSRDCWDAQPAGMVIRYDHRDTGGSTKFPEGAYTGDALRHDPLVVLDALGIERAHVAGLSMGGVMAQALALDHPDRVARLTLFSTSNEEFMSQLPGMTEALQAVEPPPLPDPDDPAAIVDYLVEVERPYSGRFDASRARACAQRAVARGHQPAYAAHHWSAPSGTPIAGKLADLDIPTLVVHGTADPMFPIEHGRALAAAIPGAELIEIDGLGHELPPPDVLARLLS